MTTRIVKAKIVILSLVAVLVVEVSVGVILGKSALPPMLILGTTRLVEIVALFLILSIWGNGISCIGLAQGQIFSGLKKGFIWSAAFGLCTVLGFAVIYMVQLNPLLLIKTNLPQETTALVLFFITGGLIAPVAEEVFFRGVVYGFLRQWGILAAIAGTTVIFVAVHLVGSGLPITQIVGGVIFCIAYEVEGKLMTPITIHVLGNTAIFTLSLIP
ncbi:MAG: CPBP family intramembrane metalloprotease [Deltaproteobacteria bacterium]|nr:CPBP family intramembrane metalloprotease [Deltaproteobacteria bacterium]